MDFLVWSLNGKRSFSTSSAYQHTNILPPTMRRMLSRMAKLLIGSENSLSPLSLNFLSGSYIMIDPLQPQPSKQGVEVNPHCFSCPNCIIESTNHLFYECPNVAELWENLISSAKYPTLITPSSFMVSNWSNTQKTTKQKTFDHLLLLHEIIHQCLWAIWKARNHNLLNHDTQKPSFQQTYAEAIEYNLLQHKGKKRGYFTIILIKWTLPRIGPLQTECGWFVPGQSRKMGHRRCHQES